METNVENNRTPLQQFLHDARVLPYFDLGDELYSFAVVNGNDAATEAETAYWKQKENK